MYIMLILELVYADFTFVFGHLDALKRFSSFYSKFQYCQITHSDRLSRFSYPKRFVRTTIRVLIDGSRQLKSTKRDR